MFKCYTVDAHTGDVTKGIPFKRLVEAFTSSSGEKPVIPGTSPEEDTLILECQPLLDRYGRTFLVLPDTKFMVPDNLEDNGSAICDVIIHRRTGTYENDFGEVDAFSVEAYAIRNTPSDGTRVVHHKEPSYIVLMHNDTAIKLEGPGERYYPDKYVLNQDGDLFIKKDVNFVLPPYRSFF